MISALELLSTGAGYLEGSLSKETALSVAGASPSAFPSLPRAPTDDLIHVGFSATFAAFALYILNY